MLPNLNRNVGTLTPQALSEICIGQPSQNPFRGQRALKRDLYYSCYLVSLSTEIQKKIKYKKKYEELSTQYKLLQQLPSSLIYKKISDYKGHFQRFQ